jgi:capsular exopolysaccharide synthesis family protein
VSDKPDNQDRDSRNSGDEDLEFSEEPEQIWPPPEEPRTGRPESGASAPDDTGWASDVEEIDEAIEEIRQINGGGSTQEASRSQEGAGGMLAGVVSSGSGDRSAATGQLASCVRAHSDEEIGQLWGSVFYSAEYAPPRAIIVTAARRRDGATQIATSLALTGASASQERHVALVDFNLRDPAVADVLGLPAEPGLTDVLDGRASLEEAIRSFSLPSGSRLDVLTSGMVAEHPLGLLKSRQAQSLIARLQERYDHTILDVTTPNAHPDPQVIGGLVQGALLVVRAGETPRETVAEAKKRLDLAGVRCLGLVLNQRSDPIPGFLYRMT